MEDIDVFLGFMCLILIIFYLFSCSKNSQITFAENLQIKKQFTKYNFDIQLIPAQAKLFKRTLENGKMPSLLVETGGSLEITLTVPLSCAISVPIS